MAEAQRAAYSLSISDLVRVLNEKLGLESSKFRGISLPLTCFASSLESEVNCPGESTSRGADENSVDRQPGSQNPRCSETHPVLAERSAASQQVATRDPLLYRPISHRRRSGRFNLDRSADARMPILARIHYLSPWDLDIDIWQERGHDCGLPAACEEISLENHSPPAFGLLVPRYLRTPPPDHTGIGRSFHADN